jgi:hypothetical protein
MISAMGLSATGCLGLFEKAEEGSPTASVVKTVTGTSWVPDVPGAGAINRDSNVTISKTTVTATGNVTGHGQSWSGREISVDIDMTQDLGAYGSISLQAVTTSYPSSLSGGAYPILTYLSDGSNDFVNLTRAGTDNCFDTGISKLNNGAWESNTACMASWPSAYFDRAHWLQHQMNSSWASYSSINTFPSCNWTGTTTPASGSPYNEPSCAFNSTFFVSSKLKSGVHYTARYVLMSDSYSSIPSGYTGGLSVSIVKKSKASNSNPSAIDINLIFVGTDVTQASRNDQGKINMDRLMAAVQNYFSAASVNVKLGVISAYEWTGGDQYSELATTQFGAMVGAGSAAVSSSSEGRAVNVFFVKSITNNSSLLGQSGGIGGPIIHGLRNSGVVVSTFGKLDAFNPDCTAASCTDAQIEEDFYTLEQTVVHEVGHYLGLNHVSESSGTSHDIVPDTPICTTVDPLYGNKLTVRSCLNLDSNVYPSTGKTCLQDCGGYNPNNDVYCSTAPECQYNYMMFWSSKYFSEGVGTGDGGLFSNGQGSIINYYPMVQ